MGSLWRKLDTEIITLVVVSALVGGCKFCSLSPRDYHAEGIKFALEMTNILYGLT